ncbi:hypothetical protein C8R45DRAFT_566502 [Mycena sanguinolenta]|nr:hypothetical protein C8R45DRAFT_566502 [Mycena sanguinolenta]
MSTIDTTSISTCSSFAARRPAKIRSDDCELRNERRPRERFPSCQRVKQSQVSPGRVPVPLELAHPHPHPYERERAPPRPPPHAKRRGQRRAACTVSTTSAPHDAAGRQVGQQSQCDSSHIDTHWHGTRQDECESGPAGCMLAARRAVRWEGHLEIANPSPSPRNSARTPERTTHVPACKTSTAWRSRWLIRMASANLVPPTSDGRMRAYRHGHSFYIRSLVTSLSAS